MAAGDVDSAVVVGVDFAKRALLLANPSFDLDDFAFVSDLRRHRSNNRADLLLSRWSLTSWVPALVLRNPFEHWCVMLVVSNAASGYEDPYDDRPSCP